MTEQLEEYKRKERSSGGVDLKQTRLQPLPSNGGLEQGAVVSVTSDPPVMPWLLSSELGHRSWSPSERQCERTAFSFYVAVRERLPVWTLEELRRMEVLCWDGGSPRPFLPSEALLYALVHDHQDYARYLLDSYSVGALKEPHCSFRSCRGGGSSLLTMAVRYERVSILAMMMAALKGCHTASERQGFLDGCGGCSHAADAGKTAVQLAVQLSRPECLRLLLVHGARAEGLDLALERLVASDGSGRRCAQRCLDLLLLFVPQVRRQRSLQEEPQRWQSLLGDAVFSWLCGRSPPPLLLQALRCLAQTGPHQIATLPDFLQHYS